MMLSALALPTSMMCRRGSCYIASKRPITAAVVDHPTTAIMSSLCHQNGYHHQVVRFRGANVDADDTVVSTLKKMDPLLRRNQQPVSSTSTSLSSQFRPVYVHHVSRIALEHLQDRQNDWLVRTGLDKKLVIRPDGTFLLTFPPSAKVAGRTSISDHHQQPQPQQQRNVDDDVGRIWTSYDSRRRQHWLCVYRHKVGVKFLLKDVREDLHHNNHQQYEFHHHRRQGLSQQPPRRDPLSRVNTTTVWNESSNATTATTTTSSSSSSPTTSTSHASTDAYMSVIQKIQSGVDEMIKLIDEVEEQYHQQHQSQQGQNR